MYDKPGALSKLRLNLDHSPVDIGVMPGDGQPKARALVLGRIIRLKNLLKLVFWDAGTIIDNFYHHRVVGTVPGFDADPALAADRLTRILQDIREDFGKMAPLHEQGRQVQREVSFDHRLV